MLSQRVGLLLIAALVAAATGCWPGSSSPAAPATSHGAEAPPVVKVAIELPAASAAEIDRLLGGLIAGRTTWPPEAERAVCVSRNGRFEAYFVGHSDVGAAELLNALFQVIPPEDLPGDAPSPERSVVSGGVPEVEPESGPEIHVQLDDDLLAAFGLTRTQVNETIAAATERMTAGPVTVAPSAQSVEELEDLVILNTEDGAVLLRDLAEIVLIHTPTCIVREVPAD